MHRVCGIQEDRARDGYRGGAGRGVEDNGEVADGGWKIDADSAYMIIQGGVSLGIMKTSKICLERLILVLRHATPRRH